MIPAGFASWREYFAFGLAREYRYLEDGRLFEMPPSRLERVGSALSCIVTGPLDFMAREIRNPMMLLALTVTSLFFVSIAFYPAHTWGLLTRALPWIQKMRAVHVQAAAYSVSQAVILGLGLRALGRFCTPELMAAHAARTIRPVPLGAP